MMKREKIYIIPTQYGFMYGFGIFASLIGGAVYNNNLAFMLCFFLVALFLIGMVQTHNNLKKMNIEKFSLFLSPSDGVGHGVLWIKSHNSDGHNQIRVESKENGDDIDFIIESIHKNSLQPHYFDFKTSRWGQKSRATLKVSTKFPFGFFYVWRKFNYPTEYYVYPSPRGDQSLLSFYQGDESQLSTEQRSGDDFSEHRAYVVGDSMKHIDWKAYARGRSLLTKKFEEGQRQSFVLNYDDTQGDEEARLKQLSKWVHECFEKRLSYSLKLGSKAVKAGFGEKHKAVCLKLLASAGASS